jgi:hypothetical protein
MNKKSIVLSIATLISLSGIASADYVIQFSNSQSKGMIPEQSVPETFSSCKDILDNGNSTGDGVYSIQPATASEPFDVYCDMTTDGGGWTQVMGGNSNNNLIQFSSIGDSGIDNVTNDSAKIKDITCDQAIHGVRIAGTSNIQYTEFSASVSWMGQGLGDFCENENPDVSADGVFLENNLKTQSSLVNFTGVDITKVTFQCQCGGSNVQSGTAVGNFWIR